jgi:hypothetical protein
MTKHEETLYEDIKNNDPSQMEYAGGTIPIEEVKRGPPHIIQVRISPDEYRPDASRYRSVGLTGNHVITLGDVTFKGKFQNVDFRASGGVELGISVSDRSPGLTETNQRVLKFLYENQRYEFTTTQIINHISDQKAAPPQFSRQCVIHSLRKLQRDNLITQHERPETWKITDDGVHIVKTDRRFTVTAQRDDEGEREVEVKTIHADDGASGWGVEQ